MEQKIISKTEEQCIYLMKETNLDFYLIIPNNKQLSIVLGLFPDVTEEVIKTLPKEKDKVLVIPVISSQILTNANHLEQVSFKYLDNVLSFLINISHKMLTHNKLSVNNKILLNNHASYENFNQQYIKKYEGRVELYNLFSKKPTTTINNRNIFEPVPTQSPESTFKPVEPPFQQKNTNSQTVDTLEESIEPILYNEPVISSPDIKENHEPGFISYILLGVLVAVISLVFLYMIL